VDYSKHEALARDAKVPFGELFASYSKRNYVRIALPEHQHDHVIGHAARAQRQIYEAPGSDFQFPTPKQTAQKPYMTKLREVCGGTLRVC
jgi:hypothetical protein